MHASWIDQARRLSLAVAVVCGSGAAAMAATPSTETVRVVNSSPDADSVLVPTTGLDLRSAAGASGLRHRVRIAAVKLCDAVMPTQPLGSDAVVDCTSESVRGATPQMDSMIAEARSSRSYAEAGPPVP
jgi:UrcA family protein